MGKEEAGRIIDEIQENSKENEAGDGENGKLVTRSSAANAEAPDDDEDTIEDGLDALEKRRGSRQGDIKKSKKDQKDHMEKLSKLYGADSEGNAFDLGINPEAVVNALPKDNDAPDAIFGGDHHAGYDHMDNFRSDFHDPEEKQEQWFIEKTGHGTDKDAQEFEAELKLQAGAEYAYEMLDSEERRALRYRVIF